MRHKHTTDKTFEKSVLQSKQPVLLEFWAAWCGPCRALAPTIDQLAQELKGDISIQKVDVDENPEVTKNCVVRGIPTLILFNKGNEQDRVIGNASRSKIYQLIQEHIYAEEFKQKPENEFAALTFIGGSIRLVSLLPDGTYKFLDETDKYHNILYTYSLENLALKHAVEEFEEMVNDPGSSEQDFHDFFEVHPDFILNDEYKQAHSKIVLEREEGGALIPDFVLQPFSMNALCDLLELKTPSANVYVLKKNRFRFSAAVMEAVAQLREYSAYFDEKIYRDRLEERYSLKAYKPRMYIILGRTGKVSPFEARRVELDVPNITFKTYDDILERMKSKVSRMI